MVRKKILKAVLASILLIPSITPANAGLDAPVNLDNPRVVPIYGGPFDTASWSGYLYSSRIVFSAAHSHYNFDSNGNLTYKELGIFTVGRPNSSAKDSSGRVKVVKLFLADFKTIPSGGAINDFVIYVLERDLVPMVPGKLITPEINQELVEAKAEVEFHGYGEYRDRCAPGQSPPCKKDWQNPNQRTSEFPRMSVMKLSPVLSSWMDSQKMSEMANERFISNPKGCPGDSGGPITTIYKGERIYLGMGLDGNEAYACGAGGSLGNKPNSFGHFSPVYKHLDLIKEAEAFVAQQTAPITSTKKTVTVPNLKKTTITCIKGKVAQKVTAVKPKCPAGYKKK
jgi:hypothetical protein